MGILKMEDLDTSLYLMQKECRLIFDICFNKKTAILYRKGLCQKTTQKKMYKQIICVLVALSIATAATQEKKEFSVASFFEGSWVIASRKVSLDSGDVIGDVTLVRYNVTKTDENEFDIFPLEKNSYLRDHEASQVVLITSSQWVGEVKKYNSEKDEFESIGEFKFVSMLPNESYVKASKRFFIYSYLLV